MNTQNNNYQDDDDDDDDVFLVALASIPITDHDVESDDGCGDFVDQ